MAYHFLDRTRTAAYAQSAEQDKDTIYLTTDTHEIFNNGKPYGGGSNSSSSAIYDDSSIVSRLELLTKKDGSLELALAALETEISNSDASINAALKLLSETDASLNRAIASIGTSISHDSSLDDSTEIWSKLNMLSEEDASIKRALADLETGIADSDASINAALKLLSEMDASLNKAFASIGTSIDHDGSLDDSTAIWSKLNLLSEESDKHKVAIGNLETGLADADSSITSALKLISEETENRKNAIGELKADITDLDSSISTALKLMSSEDSSLESAIAVLSASIYHQGDTSLDDTEYIKSELALRAKDCAELKEAYAKLNTSIEHSDSSISSALELISQETTDRKTAISNLSSRIDNTDSSISAALKLISEETEDRKTAISGLDSRINTADASISSALKLISEETENRKTAIGGLESRIDASDSSISTALKLISEETENRKTAISGLDSRINTADSSIATALKLVSEETENRKSAISAMESAIEDASVAFASSISAVSDEIDGLGQTYAQLESSIEGNYARIGTVVTKDENGITSEVYLQGDNIRIDTDNFDLNNGDVSMSGSIHAASGSKIGGLNVISDDQIAIGDPSITYGGYKLYSYPIDNADDKTYIGGDSSVMSTVIKNAKIPYELCFETGIGTDGTVMDRVDSENECFVRNNEVYVKWIGADSTEYQRPLNTMLSSLYNSSTYTNYYQEDYPAKYVYIDRGLVTVIDTDYISMGTTFDKSKTQSLANTNAPILLNKDGSGRLSNGAISWTASGSSTYKGNLQIGGTKNVIRTTGSGQLSNGNLKWDTAGNVTMKNASMSNCKVSGDITAQKLILTESEISASALDDNNAWFVFEGTTKDGVTITVPVLHWKSNGLEYRLDFSSIIKAMNDASNISFTAYTAYGTASLSSSITYYVSSADATKYLTSPSTSSGTVAGSIYALKKLDGIYLTNYDGYGTISPVYYSQIIWTNGAIVTNGKVYCLFSQVYPTPKQLYISNYNTSITPSMVAVSDGGENDGATFSDLGLSSAGTYTTLTTTSNSTEITLSSIKAFPFEF